MAYSTSNEYKRIIYSGDARHKLKIWFNGNELVDADRYCETIIRTPRILPNDGSKRFSLDNFMAQQITIILHDIDANIIADQVEISIGTLISGNNYEYVPLGIFNIQGTPKTDKNKITITLRDNRTKFEFGYNAKPLIDALGGTATKKQILNDICEKAGVISDVSSFLGENDEIGIYDNSIKGNIYVSYIAEQAGRIPIIKRNGHLDFINLKNLTIHKIPLFIVEKYELGNNYNIQRVEYESGLIKYETSNDKTLDTLFINSANPYIQNQEHINNIFTNVSNFQIDSVKTGEIMGDPAIDPYDLIQVYGYYDENNHFVNDEETIVFTTLANYTMTYTGKIINEYNTQIGLEERKNNTTISGEAVYRKYAKSEYDNVNASLSIMSGQINNQNEQIALIRVQYNEILSKISDIADITVSGESNVANVTLREVNTSQPIDIKIHPIDENISYLYPHIGLYPDANLYLKVRMVRFTNITTSEIFDWVLPTNLWYYDNENYDELELSYGDGTNSTVTVTRKCEINADGTTSLLANPITETYPYPSGLVLSDGDYNVSLVGYSTGYLYVQLMAKNIYTTQFYTKAETNSIISQTASTINIGVDTKLENYAKTTELTSAINLTNQAINAEVTRATTNENALSSRIGLTASTIELTTTDNNTSAGIKIKLLNENGDQIGNDYDANITLSGLVKFTDLSNSNPTTTIINGSNITTGTIDATKVIVKNLDASKIITGTIDANTINITNINASNIKSGNIQSTNYVSGSAGTKISLSDGSIDTKNFKLNNTGAITIYDTGGTLTGNANIQILSSVSGSKQKTVFKSSGFANFYNSSNPDDNNVSISTIFGYPEMQLIKGNYSGILSNEQLLFIKSQSGSSDVTTTIRASGIVTPSVTQTSLETQKKNFEKFENGIKVIKNIDIYKYNLISEKNSDKKHIGFVIGDKFNYSKEITSKNNDGVDLYSMISVVLQAVKEQQQQIEKLEGLING